MLALYIIAGFILFLILLLCIPVETTVTMDTESGKKYSLIISWLFGIVKKDVGKRRSKRTRERQATERRKRIPAKLDFELVSQIDTIVGLIRRFKDLISGIYRQLKIKKITGDIVVGFEDPVHTGMLFAVIGPANALLNLHPRYDVSIRPFFDDENILAGNLYGNVKVRPIRLVGPALKLATSKEVRRLGNHYIKKRWWRR